MTTKRNANFGWTPDHPDFRDHEFLPKVIKIKKEVDLRAQMPEVYDQGDLGSCTANAIAAAMQFLRPESFKDTYPSRLQIYYNERKMEGTVNEDSGAMLRDGIKVVVKLGVAPETFWIYDIEQFTNEPDEAATLEALNHQALKYKRINNKYYSHLKGCLSQGLPFVFGFTVYDSFMDIGPNGMMKMPTKKEGVLGGHAVIAVGYKTIKGKLYFLVRNSWGPEWGMQGHFWMPAPYMMNTNLADDFWAIQTEE